MKSKKTVTVQSIKERVNKFNIISPDDSRERRITLSCFLESILHETGNYRGFNYLDKKEMEKAGLSFGVYRAESGDWAFDGTDDSRVFYY
jgi:hypothetical protein